MTITIPIEELEEEEQSFIIELFDHLDLWPMHLAWQWAMQRLASLCIKLSYSLVEYFDAWAQVYTLFDAE